MSELSSGGQLSSSCGNPCGLGEAACLLRRAPAAAALPVCWARERPGPLYAPSTAPGAPSGGEERPYADGGLLSTGGGVHKGVGALFGCVLLCDLDL
jgi:hypothetical protein